MGLSKCYCVVNMANNRSIKMKIFQNNKQIDATIYCLRVANIYQIISRLKLIYNLTDNNIINEKEWNDVRQKIKLG